MCDVTCFLERGDMKGRKGSFEVSKEKLFHDKRLTCSGYLLLAVCKDQLLLFLRSGFTKEGTEK